MNDKLNIEKYKARTFYKSQFSKSWAIYNPTNETFVMKGRGGESCVLQPVNLKGLDNNKLYITIKYTGGVGTNLSYYRDYNGLMVQEVGDDFVILSIELADIVDSEKGIFVPELDMSIGLKDKLVVHPSRSINELIASEDAIYHQFFLNIQKSKGPSKTFVKLGTVVLEVQVASLGGVEGLYTWITRAEGNELVLLDSDPFHNPDAEKLTKSNKQEMRHEHLESKAFSQYLERVYKVTRTESERVNEEFKEDQTIRSTVRSDIVDDIKHERTMRKEEHSSASEAASHLRSNTKSVYDVASTVSKLI